MDLNPLHVLHGWAGAADWSRPRLDAAARRLSSADVRTLVERATPDRLVPHSRHRVSVVIPCFNYGRYLPAAVGSALSQRGVDVEIVVVDDCSTDDSAAVAESLAARYERVHVLRNLKNQGQGQTFNNGLDAATGDFVVRLDADDLLTPGSLARAVALFEANPEVGLVYGHPRHFAAPLPPAPRIGSVTWTVWDGDAWLEERCRRGVNCITTSEAMVRASVVDLTGGFDNRRLKFAQDLEWWCRIAAISDVGRVNDVDQALHRDHPGSLSVTSGGGYLTDLRERFIAFDCVFDAVSEQADGGADAVRLRALAHRTLALESLDYVAYQRDRGLPDPELVDDLLDFAQKADPAVTDSQQWVALQRQLARGGARSWDPAAALRVVRSRGRSELDYLRWTRAGL